MKARFTFFSLMVMLSACVGTDLKDDPIIGVRIEISRQQVALQFGQNVQLIAEYYDQYFISRYIGHLSKLWLVRLPICRYSVQTCHRYFRLR